MRTATPIISGLVKRAWADTSLMFDRVRIRRTVGTGFVSIPREARLKALLSSLEKRD
jgi:hypothetical protein